MARMASRKTPWGIRWRYSSSPAGVESPIDVASTSEPTEPPANCVDYDLNDLRQYWEKGSQEVAKLNSAFPWELRPFHEMEHDVKDVIQELMTQVLCRLCGPFSRYLKDRGQQRHWTYLIYLAITHDYQHVGRRKREHERLYGNDADWKKIQWSVLRFLIDDNSPERIDEKFESAFVRTFAELFSPQTPDCSPPAKPESGEAVFSPEEAKWPEHIQWLIKSPIVDRRTLRALEYLLAGLENADKCRETWWNLVKLEAEPMMDSLTQIEHKLEDGEHLTEQEIKVLAHHTSIGLLKYHYPGGGTGASSPRTYIELPGTLSGVRIADRRSRCFPSPMYLAAFFLVCAPAHKLLDHFRIRELGAHSGGPIDNVFRQLGKSAWLITFRGRTRPIKNVRGLHYIKVLLSHKGEYFTPQQVVVNVGGGPPVRSSAEIEDSRPDIFTKLDADFVADAEAIHEYKKTLEKLDEEIRQAEEEESLNLKELKKQRKMIKKVLVNAAVGRKKGRKLDPTSGSVRTGVGNAIQEALELIGCDGLPELQVHLKESIQNIHGNKNKTYRPYPDVEWSF